MQEESAAQAKQLVEIEPRKFFSRSLLEPPIQSSLVDEITTKLQQAILRQPPSSLQNKLEKLRIFRKEKPAPSTHPKVYVVTSHRVEEGVINPPFTITTENPGEHAYTTVQGPFDPQLAAAVAYLEQEGRMLMAAPSANFHPEVKTFANKHDIHRLGSYGGGIGGLASELHHWKKSYPQETREEILKKAIEKYQAEIKQYKKRAQEATERFGNPDSQSLDHLSDLTSRLQGFETGILLLDELLAYPWISSE